MSARARAWARPQKPGGLALKAALMVLAELADQRGVCSESVSVMAAEACTDERTMRRLLDRLEEAGLVEAERRSGRTTIYRLPLKGSETPGSHPYVTPGSHPGVTQGSQPGVTPGSHPPRGETQGSHPGVTQTDAGLSPRPLPLQGEVQPPPSGVVTRAPARDARTREGRHLPADWAPHAGHHRAAHRRGADLDHEAAQFRAHAQANARIAADWDAAFDLWLGNSRPVNRPGSSLLPVGANGTRVPTTTARVQAVQALRRPEQEHP